MKLTANVRYLTGSTRHHVIVAENESTVELQPAVTLEITDSEGGFLLIRRSLTGFAGDTWHATLDEAKRQAEVEFGVEAAEWGGSATA
jgi:hypothetical protein